MMPFRFWPLPTIADILITGCHVHNDSSTAVVSETLCGLPSTGTVFARLETTFRG